MTASLEDVNRKVARAEKKAGALLDDIVNFCQSNPISLRVDYRPERHGVNLICQMDKLHAPLKEWSIQTGEIIHLLRSALDNLIFACARTRLDPPAKPRKLQFPIIQDKGQYQNAIREILPQLPPQIVELLEKIQPFQREQNGVEGSPENDPLVLLNWMSNHDKHRMPVPFLIPPKEIEFSQACMFNSEEDASANTPPDVVVHVGPLRHNALLMEYRTKHPIQWAKGNFNITANVAFETHVDTRDLSEAIKQLIWYTGLVTNEFSKHLPH